MRKLSKEEIKKIKEDISKGIDPHAKLGGKYIKNAVWGGLDGLITTFAVVAGVVGASLSISVLLILGFANLFADGISMSFGDYLSSKARKEYQEKEKKKEEWEVSHCPEEEKEESMKFYMKHGLSRLDALKVVNIFSKKKRLWISEMLAEELGIAGKEYDPVKTSAVTFISFVIFGFIPLITFVLIYFIPSLSINTFNISAVLTAIGLFGLGAAKVKITGRNWFISGIEMLVIGGTAALAAYFIGYYISTIV